MCRHEIRVSRAGYWRAKVEIGRVGCGHVGCGVLRQLQGCRIAEVVVVVAEIVTCNVLDRNGAAAQVL